MKHASHIHSGKAGKEQEYLEGWQRARAELDNFRKQMRLEVAAQAQRASQANIPKVLALADNFQAIMSHVPPELAGNAWVQGVLHVARQCDQLLAELGVEVFGAVGEQFDPRRHEAVEQIAGEGESKVVAVLQRGYKTGDLVLRPAKVKVSNEQF